MEAANVQTLHILREVSLRLEPIPAEALDISDAALRRAGVAPRRQVVHTLSSIVVTALWIGAAVLLGLLLRLVFWVLPAKVGAFWPSMTNGVLADKDMPVSQEEDYIASSGVSELLFDN